MSENYHDSDGNPISLGALVRGDPTWAVARIRDERRMREVAFASVQVLEEALERLTAEVALLLSQGGRRAE